MKVSQLHTLVNTVTSEVLGEQVVLNEDLSNLVDVGKEIINNDQVDNYVKKLVNHIGKVVFVSRIYSGGAPSVMMDAWEYGSILQKVTAELPDAIENSSWNLVDGKSYDQDVFHQPEVSNKFFNSKTTFEIALSFTEKQIKESFSSAEQLNGFVSMLVVSVENSMTIKLDALVMRTINSMIAHTIANDLFEKGVLVEGKDSVKAINLLKLFNGLNKTDLTPDVAITNPEFIKFATYQIQLVSDRLSKISSLFNIGGKERFTPKDKQHIVLLSDFAKASDTFLLSSTYHGEKLALPQHETVPYWQGSGKDYSLDSVSTIDVKLDNKTTVKQSGILGVIFDREALGVTNLENRTTTNYNAKAEFYNNYYKAEAGYFNDTNENFVLFYMQ